MEPAALRILIGLIVGTLIGMTGLGGGVLLLPILIFGLGVPAIKAVGSDALSADTGGDLANEQATEDYLRSVTLLEQTLLTGGKVHDELLRLRDQKQLHIYVRDFVRYNVGED